MMVIMARGLTTAGSWAGQRRFLLVSFMAGGQSTRQNCLKYQPRSVMSKSREECQFVLQLRSSKPIYLELQSMDRLGKGVVRSLAARSRKQPENEMLGPSRAYRRIILCRNLRLNYHRRILRFGRRAREISRPGGQLGEERIRKPPFSRTYTTIADEQATYTISA